MQASLGRIRAARLEGMFADHFLVENNVCNCGQAPHSFPRSPGLTRRFGETRRIVRPACNGLDGTPWEPRLALDTYK